MRSPFDDGKSGRELWRSNGTAAGTALIVDIRAGASGGNWRIDLMVPDNPALIGAQALFQVVFAPTATVRRWEVTNGVEVTLGR